MYHFQTFVLLVSVLVLGQAQKPNGSQQGRKISLKKLSSILHAVDTVPGLKNISKSEILRLLEKIKTEDLSTTTAADICANNFVEQEDKIIRTHDSLENGAQFLKPLRDIQSLQLCEEECCKYRDPTDSSKRCDLSLFQVNANDNGGAQCYLFSCYTKDDLFNSRCLFADHAGYVAYVRVQAHDHLENPSEVVDDLKSIISGVPGTTTSTSTKTTTPSSTKVLSTSSAPTSILVSATTTTTAATTTTTTAATTTTATPLSTSVLTKYTTTTARADSSCISTKCSRLQWKCDNGCCISVLNVCDGARHCTDGSDEIGCTADKASAPLPDDEAAEHELKETLSEFDTKHKSTTTSRPTLSRITPTTSVAQGGATATAELIKTNKNDAEQALGEGLSVKEEELTFVDPDKGAVLPLAIGLAVVSSILLMVACRVRVMRKKMYKRRGPLAMDESDYLINGMYM